MFVCLYGHTHVAKYEQIGGIHVINPGSISQSRSQIEETFAELVYKEDENTIILNFRNRENRSLKQLRLNFRQLGIIRAKLLYKE